jgi:hypothetical protein
VIHAYNFNPANYANRFAAPIADLTFHSVTGSGPLGYVMTSEQFYRDCPMEDLTNLVFAESDTDLAARVIFADLHLEETGGGAANEHARHFGIIGGLLEATIKPAGPYALVLWTIYPDQAAALHAFLQERLNDVAAPYVTVALDKAQHLDVEGKVIDAEALIRAITDIGKGTNRLPRS